MSIKLIKACSKTSDSRKEKFSEILRNARLQHSKCSGISPTSKWATERVRHLFWCLLLNHNCWEWWGIKSEIALKFCKAVYKLAFCFQNFLKKCWRGAAVCLGVFYQLTTVKWLEKKVILLPNYIKLAFASKNSKFQIWLKLSKRLTKACLETPELYIKLSHCK